MAAVSPARKAAFNVLVAVERGQSHADDLLRGKGVSVLAVADRNLTTTLVLGVLRWQLRLDATLQALLARPNARLDAEVRIALRLGAFQLLHLDRIPARAAIDESVELTKQAGHRFAAGMVNAVLRKLAVHAARFSTMSADEQIAAAVAAHPAWMVERWTRFYGAEAARAICLHGQCPPTLSVRVTDAHTEASLAKDGVTLEKGKLLTAAHTVTAGDMTATAALREGRARVHDEGSQLVAEIAAAVAPQAREILDCCAAPGGKTLILAERCAEAHLTACEASPQRLEQLRTRLAPLGRRVECRLADAAVPAAEGVYDLVLADVPCSGTGTLGRNPEIRHRLRVEDLPRQAGRQRAILESALRAVRTGGRVVYSTCSLEPEENEDVVATTLAWIPNARIVAAAACIAALLRQGVLAENGAERLQGCVTPEGFLRLLPGTLHTDGFFIAVVEKSA